MANIQSIIRQINKELVPQFEERLRVFLAEQDREWLIEQIIRMALDAHSLQEMDRKQLQAAKVQSRAERIERLRAFGLDQPALADFIARHRSSDRESLIRDGYLLEGAPFKGTDLIGQDYRTVQGNRLLQQAKDILFGLLFGDESSNTRFERRQRELLSFTMPRFKADALDFMKAATELSAAGTWQDPDSISNDSRADNVIFEVEYGEIAGEWIGHGIIRCLSLINNLEVNEQVLYARMINIEESTLIE